MHSILSNDYSLFGSCPLWGNKGDLSHSAGKEKSESTSLVHDPHHEQHGMKEALIADDSEAIWQHLQKSSSKHCLTQMSASHVRVDIVCDNYGFVEFVLPLSIGWIDPSID